MTEVLIPLGWGALAGLLLSTASHAALWWTVRRVPLSRRPARLLALSSFARIGVVAVGLATLAWLSPWALAGGAVGFLAARTVAIARLAPEQGRAFPGRPARREKEGPS